MRNAMRLGGGGNEEYRMASWRGVKRTHILAGAIVCLVLSTARDASPQAAPASPERPWHSPQEQQLRDQMKQLRDSRPSIDPTKIYSLTELIDLAESHNPETRVAWESARAQIAALGVARSELYPTLSAIAFSQTDRTEIYFGTQFHRQAVQTFEGTLELSYVVLDFGSRAGRIDAAKAELLAANVAFNDTHRRLIYEVEQTYYRLLHAMGQEQAARANLANAQTVQQAAEDRLKNGLATLPDVLEARSATAQAEYEVQTVLGAEEIARGDLTTALGTSAAASIQVQPLDQIPTPESISDSVDAAIDRALQHRPDLMQQIANVRSAYGRVKEARAAYYPTLTVNVTPTAQSLYAMQQAFPWGHTAGLTGGLTLSLNWTVFDGGARKNQLAQAEANSRAADAQVDAARDQITDQVWTAYSNLKTALRQRQSALALLAAANQSYAAALEAYNSGVRSFLDVTAAQQTLAQARSTDVLARTQVLNVLATLAFQTSDAIELGTRRSRP